jgi:hypothetical protein
MKKLASLYKKHLSPSLFDSASYKRCVAANGKSEPQKVKIRDGFEDFGIPDGVNVYIIKRDLFLMFIVEEQGEMRILTFGIGG